MMLALIANEFGFDFSSHVDSSFVFIELFFKIDSLEIITIFGHLINTVFDDIETFMGFIDFLGLILYRFTEHP